MKALSNLIFGILFTIGHGLIIGGMALEALDGPVTATVAAGKGLAKVAKKTPHATVKTMKAVGKAIK